MSSRYDKAGTPEKDREPLGQIDPNEPLGGDVADESGRVRPTPTDLANQQAIKEKARPEAIPDRDDLLVHVGRGHQTAGRGGQGG